MTLSHSAYFPSGGSIPCPKADYRLNLPKQSCSYVFELNVPIWFNLVPINSHATKALPKISW